MRNRGAELALLATALLLWAAPCRAAKVRMHVPRPAVEVGQEGVAFLELMPDPGESVRGAWVSLSVNPEYVMLLSDRTHYASDPAFSKVEKFTVDSLNGALVYRVQTDKPLSENKILLRIPLKFMQPGLSSITFTSSIYAENMERVTANSGYQRLAGYKGELDPLLLSSLEGENSTLTATALHNEIEFTAPERKASIMEASLGISALEEASGDADADVVIEFSKRQATIGLRQWVRLDVVITKFPQNEMLAAAAFKVKYDPSAFTYTDSRGQEAAAVELNEYFNMGFVNRVDRNKGEIDIQVGLDLTLSDATVLETMPVTLVSLYFKGMKQTTDEQITLEEVKVPVSRPGSKLARHGAAVTVKPSEAGCDKDLPATLCSGSFKVSGTVAFNISNKNEVQRTAVVGQFSDEQTGATQNVRVKKYFLEQRWNLGMNGSLRNGVRLQGSLVDEPNMEQRLNMEMIGQDTTARFGDFSASMVDSKLTALKASDVTGLQLIHKHKGLSFRGLLAELKSSPGPDANIKGNGSVGPYSLNIQGAAIIPASVTVYRQNEILSSSEYIIDFGRNQITFKQPLQNNETVIVKYQQSSLLFSTGNIRAFRADYQSGNENVKIGSTYITTMSPKSTAQSRLVTTEAVTEAQVITPEESTGTTKSFDCGYFGEGRKCFEIKLAHTHIVEGSIEIKNEISSDTATYNQDSKYIYIDHRGHLEGRFFVDTTKFPSVKMSVTYTYYNPVNLTQRAFVLFPISAASQGSSEVRIDTEGRWPTDMFPGSEILYLSDDEQYDVTEGADNIVCYSDESEGDTDKSSFCPGVFGNSNHKYEFEITGFDTLIRIYGGVVDKPVLKVLYTPVPPDSAGGSEFQKVAWGVDTNIKVGKKIEIKAEYAQANSDLSASFNTNEDQIIVDPNTLEINTSTIVKPNCTYDPTADAIKSSDDKLTCRLTRTGVYGAVIVKVQLCNEFDNALEVCTLYDTVTYDILVPRSRVDKDKGTITFERGEWLKDYGSIVRFPNQGDKFFVIYTYEQKLDKVVTGDAYFIDTAYRSKNLQVNLLKRGRDPLFDTAVSLLNDSVVDHLGGDVAWTFKKKWKMNYEWRQATEQVVDNETGVLSSNTDRDNEKMSLSYSSGSLKALKLSRDTKASKGFTGADETTRTLTDEENTIDSLDFLLSMRKNVYAITGNISKNAYEYRIGSKPNTESAVSNFAFKYTPSRKYDLNVAMSDSHSSDGNKSEAKAYSLNFRAIPYVKELRLEYKDTDTRPRYGSDFSEVQDIAYNLQFMPLWAIENLNFNFRRQDTPGGSTDNPDTRRSDSLTVSFNTQYKNYLKFLPSYNRNVSMTETKSYNYSRGYKWTVEYKLPKSKYNPSTSYTRTENSTSNRNFTTGGAETLTTSQTSTLVLDFDASKKIRVSAKTDRSEGSTAPTRNSSLSLGYQLLTGLTLNTRLSFNRTLGATPRRSTTQSMDFVWKMTEDTNLSLKYSRTATPSGAAAGTLPVTTFSMETQTRFK